jgi:hypothetical protein
LFIREGVPNNKVLSIETDKLKEKMRILIYWLKEILKQQLWLT